MTKPKKKFDAAEIIGNTIGLFVAVVIFSLIPTALWMCFDDFLSDATGIPAIGNAEWYHVWAMTTFVQMVFKRNSWSRDE